MKYFTCCTLLNSKPHTELTKLTVIDSLKFEL